MSEKHCIVGAGPGGLAAARAFKNLGLSIDVFERHDAVGGIWDRANPGTPMYESAHFISSRDKSAYHGFKMPATYPDYPNHRQILEYLRAFATAYGLDEHVRLSTSVERAAWDGSHWQVTTSDGHTRAYLTLTCANGTQWHPSMPELPGTDSFTGQIMHSNAYNEGAQLAGKRVLVVGAGNSGVDIACDAARFARSASISVRRGYFLIPKHIFGMPADAFADSGPHLPMKVAQRIFPPLLKIIMGDPTKHGWPAPDHKLFETHPIVNDQILHHLRHGDLTVRPVIASFSNEDVVFMNGTREPFDLVILATGYATKVPYLAIGFTEGDGGAYELFDDMADLIARTAWAAEHNKAQFVALQRRFASPDPDVSGGVKHQATDRHAAYVNLQAYKKASKSLRKQFDWPAVDQTTFEALR
jgi:hypothetical protein